MFERIELFFQSALWDIIEGTAILIGLTIWIISAFYYKFKKR